MAINKPVTFVYHPHLPDRARLSLDDITIVYDEALDALYVDFERAPQPAVSIDIDDSDVYARVNPETNVVVGMQIENFLRRAVRDNPELLIFAEAAGVTSERIAQVRDTIDPLKLRAVALNKAFAELKAVESS